MSVRRETELYAPLKAFFESRGYEVKAEVNRCDLVGVREDLEQPLIVEMKKTFNLSLLLQGVERLRMSPVVYLAVERPRDKGRTGGRRWNELCDLCRRLGLGLITVTFYKTKAPLVEVLAEPEEPPSPKRGGARRRERLLHEFRERSGDYNTGGSTRVPLITAYREKALRVALALEAAGAEAEAAESEAAARLAAETAAHGEAAAGLAADGEAAEAESLAAGWDAETGLDGLAAELVLDREAGGEAAAQGGTAGAQGGTAGAAMDQAGQAAGAAARLSGGAAVRPDAELALAADAPSRPDAASAQTDPGPGKRGRKRKAKPAAYEAGALRSAKPAAEGVSPAELRRLSGVPAAAAILQRNYYGWFTRVNRGRYALTPAGRAALLEYAAVTAAGRGEPPGGD